MLKLSFFPSSVHLLFWLTNEQESHVICQMRFRSSHPEVFCRKGVLRNFAKFTEKYLRQSLRPATLLKKRVWYSCFPVNFEKFLRTLFSQNTSGRLLLLLEFFFLKAFATLRHYKEKWKLRENCLYSELFWSTFSLI